MDCKSELPGRHTAVGGSQSRTDDTIGCDATKLALTKTSEKAGNTHAGIFCVM